MTQYRMQTVRWLLLILSTALLLALITMTGCSADIKVAARAADTTVPSSPLPPTGPDSSWFYIARNSHIAYADSVKIGECMLYDGYFRSDSYRQLQCPASVRPVTFP